MKKSLAGPLCLMLFSVVAGLAEPMADRAAAVQTYRGFTIDGSLVVKAANFEAILAATREQIDMVHAVGLPADILAFCASVKFRLMPDGSFAGSTPGRYVGGGDQSVQVSTKIVTTGHKPVLLHELLHAYHDQRIERGYRNRAILGFYEKAKAISAYAAKSHMMSNEKEFFACAATTYLFGVTAQEPFRREKVRDSQPEFQAYLQKLFGPGAGSHAGSLTRE